MNINKLRELFDRSNDKYADAKAIGTTYQTLYNILNKGTTFKVDLLERIAHYYNVPVGYFFDDSSVSQKSTGDSNVMVGRDNTGNISTSECQNKLEDALLEIKHLKERLKDKEEMIEILKEKNSK